MARADGSGLHVLVLVKQVPRHDVPAELDSTGTLVRDGLPAELNPFCRRAVAHAVRVAHATGGTSTALTMGPPSAVDVLREARACGVDAAVLLSDRKLAGSDCLATARALHAAIALLPPPDLVIVGRNSVDADTGAVGPMLAELLGVPFVGPALALDVEVVDGRSRLRADLQHDHVEEQVEVRGPAVVAVAERSIPPAKAPPESWPSAAGITHLSTRDLPDGDWGLAGSGTDVVAVRSASTGRAGTIFPGSLADQVSRAVDTLVRRGGFAPGDIEDGPADVVPEPSVEHRSGPRIRCLLGPDPSAQRALLGEAAVLAHRLGGHVIAVGHRSEVDPAKAASWGADELTTVEHADPAPLAAALQADAGSDWAVLAPATTWGREVLARLAVRLGAGLIVDAIHLDLTQPARRLVGSKPSGGRVVAEIACRTGGQLATVRTGCLRLRPPRADPPRLTVTPSPVPADPAVLRLSRTVLDAEDALDRARIVIGVGRGVPPERYRDLDRLRQGLAAELAATRPVTDAGWLPHGRQLGITARDIAPRLYIAIGISGSANHLAGVHRAHSVLAINADPGAPVFAAADVGIVGNWQAAVPLLEDELRRRRLSV